MSISVKYTAKATSTGGRNGHTRSDDGLVSVDLTIPKGFGGPGRPGATTPEHLFAAGYAACFGSAIEHVALQKGCKCEGIQVEAAVGIGSNGEGGFGLSVTLTVTLDGVSPAEAEELVRAAHQICPYSNAVRGNVDVTLKVA
jgi:osmotically inducible protein OsmC